MSLNELATAPSEAVILARGAWDNVRTKFPGDLDSEIVDILDRLNRIDGVATVYSCSAHDNPPRGLKEIVPRDQFYIRMVATRKGVEKVAKIYSKLLVKVELYMDARYLVDTDRDPEEGEEAVVRRSESGSEHIKQIYSKVGLDKSNVRLTLLPQRVGRMHVPGIMLRIDIGPRRETRFIYHDLLRNVLDEMGA